MVALQKEIILTQGNFISDCEARKILALKTESASMAELLIAQNIFSPPTPAAVPPQADEAVDAKSGLQS